MKKITLILGLGVLLAGVPGQAAAQNASDVTGPTTTSGDIAGGAFSPTPGTVAANASPAVTAAVGAAGAAVTATLTAGTLTATTPSGQTVTIPAAAQATVLSVLTGANAPPQLLAALEASGSPAAGELGQALQGLLSSPATGQLAEAIGFFNAVVGDANPAFLASPPAEFLAVHSVLTTLTGAAQSAM